MEDARCKMQDTRSLNRSSSPHHPITPSPYRFVLIFVFIAVSFTNLQAQTSGCTDPQANNYNASATVNNGSCTYDQTSYTPTSFLLFPQEVDETSGLIFYNDAIWTHNDSGNDAVIYKIDTLSGNILKEVFISNFTNIDWEEISQDDDYIYIGDFGNNDGTRQDLRILKVLKADIGSKYYDTVNAEALYYNYSDQTSFPSLPNNNNFDCEAMICVGDSIFLFSKNWQNQKTKLYTLPKTSENHTAILIDSLNVSGLIAGASYNASNEAIILTGYTSYVPMLWLLFDYNQGFFSGNKRRIDMPGILGSQTEGICFFDDENIYVSSEDTKIFSQRAYSIPLSQWLPSSPAYVYQVIYNEEVSIVPNPANNKVSVEVIGNKNVEPVVEVFDQMGNSCDLYYSVFTPTEKGCSVSINVDHLKAGFYIIKVSIGNRVKVAKLIIN